MKRFPHIWKFNWRLIVLHVLVTFLFSFSAEQLARLTALPLLRFVHEHRNDLAQHIKDYPAFFDQITDYYTVLVYLPLASLILIFILSLVISARNKFSFLNAVVVLIVSLFAFFYGAFFNYYARFVLFSPGRMVIDSSLAMAAIINGIYLFALSFILLYSPFIKRHWVLRQAEKSDRQLLDE